MTDSGYRTSKIKLYFMYLTSHLFAKVILSLTSNRTIEQQSGNAAGLEFLGYVCPNFGSVPWPLHHGIIGLGSQIR